MCQKWPLIACDNVHLSEQKMFSVQGHPRLRNAHTGEEHESGITEEKNSTFN